MNYIGERVFISGNLAKTNLELRLFLNGSRRLSNIFWAIAVSIGGLGFFLAGLSSFLGINLLFFSDSSIISFFPQGFVLIFYGTIGSILGIFLFLTIWWDVGSGYNEYNQNLKKIILYRKGFPGKGKELKFNFSFDEVKTIKIRIKDGINPKRQLFLCLIDKREIPLKGSDQLAALNEIEKEAIKIAKYLNVFLEIE